MAFTAYGALRQAAAALAMTVLLSACGVSGGTPGTPPGQPGTQVVEIQIHRVTVDIAKSNPPQVQLRVSGVVGDACNKLDKVTQSRQGTQVTVRITALRQTGQVCAQLAQLFDETVRLEGTFAPGTYSVSVNGYKAGFSIP